MVEFYYQEKIKLNYGGTMTDKIEDIIFCEGVMKKEKTFCDICKEETEIKPEMIQVIFTTGQTKGTEGIPYLSNENLDICAKCKFLVLKGNYLFGFGAQGHNTYEFSLLKERTSLEYHESSTIGLWATDMPGLLTSEERLKYSLFQI